VTILGLLVRTLACFALVFATWNPSRYDYLAWIGGDAALPAKALVGATLLMLHMLFARIAWLSLRLAGTAATLAILLTGIFALSELGVVDLASGTSRGYLGLASLALLLTTGMIWSLLKRRVSGQANYLSQPP
jgi:hypothetical protein